MTSVTRRGAITSTRSARRAEASSCSGRSVDTSPNARDRKTGRQEDKTNHLLAFPSSCEFLRTIDKLPTGSRRARTFHRHARARGRSTTPGHTRWLPACVVLTQDGSTSAHAEPVCERNLVAPPLAFGRAHEITAPVPSPLYHPPWCVRGTVAEAGGSSSGQPTEKPLNADQCRSDADCGSPGVYRCYSPDDPWQPPPCQDPMDPSTCMPSSLPCQQPGDACGNSRICNANLMCLQIACSTSDCPADFTCHTGGACATRA